MGGAARGGTTTSLFRTGAAFIAVWTAGTVHWSYMGADGPAHWAELSPEFRECAVGQLQSPIDIRNATPANLPPLELHYQPVPLRTVNNGHTIQVDAPEAPGASQLVVGAHAYKLVQLHFHAPSEESIDGVRHALVAHLVHKDADGHFAVIAVLFDPGPINEPLRPLFDNLPLQAGAERTVQGATLDLAAILPQVRGYYEYEGSLTTPPCSEEVRWFVMKVAVPISARQLAAFRTFYPNNARPLQPSHGRPIRQSMP